MPPTEKHENPAPGGLPGTTWHPAAPSKGLETQFGFGTLVSLQRIVLQGAADGGRFSSRRQGIVDDAQVEQLVAI